MMKMTRKRRGVRSALSPPRQAIQVSDTPDDLEYVTSNHGFLTSMYEQIADTMNLRHTFFRQAASE